MTGRPDTHPPGPDGSGHAAPHASGRGGPGRFLRPFQRITSSGAFIPEIDGLRFIAIGTVVLFHLAVNLQLKSPGVYQMPAGNFLAEVARWGFHGVELFFIISGFILAVPFASHSLLGARAVNLKKYFLRRLTRLEPPYIICMVGFFLLLVLLKGRDGQELLPHLAASLLYVHNAVFGTESLINNVAWSLEIEVQFYVLVPLLAYLLAVRTRLLRRWLLVAAIAVALGLAASIPPESARLWYSLVHYLHFFLLGFLLADIYLTDWKGTPGTGYAWDLVSLLGWPLLWWVWSAGGVIEAVGFPFLALLLYIAVFRGKITNRIMTIPLITTIGGMCYTIYLLHNPLMGVVIDVTKGIAPSSSYTVNLLLQAAIVLPVMLAISAAYFVMFEKPFMRKDWPARLEKRLRGRSGDTTGNTVSVRDAE